MSTSSLFSPCPLRPRLFLETICLLPFWCSPCSLLVGRLGWVRIPPHCLWFCLALLSSPLKLVSSHIVLTGRLSTGSHQYFARIRANSRSCNCFTHGHRQSGFHRINRGTFLSSGTAQISICLLLAFVTEHSWHSDQHVQSIRAGWVIRGCCVPVLKFKWQTNGVLHKPRTLSLLLMTGLWFYRTHMHIFALSRVYKQVSLKTLPLVCFPSAVFEVLMHLHTAFHLAHHQDIPLQLLRTGKQLIGRQRTYHVRCWALWSEQIPGVRENSQREQPEWRQIPFYRSFINICHFHVD